MKKRFILGIGLALGAFVLLFAYGIYSEKTPEFFPLTDADAQYIVVKDTTLGSGVYSIDYHGKKLWTPSGPTSVMVGNSKVNLESFINKNVTIHGSFGSGSKQCIVSACKSIGGPFVILNIDSIKIK